MISQTEIKNWFSSLQEKICDHIEKADGTGSFIKDPWERPGGGGGLTRVLSGGTILEKAGVNFSEVYGDTPKEIAHSLPQGKENTQFFATGVSIVMHPYNPMVPIIHMNVRFFQLSHQDKPDEKTWWFGGGIDLTPHYVIEEDARYFHQQLKEACMKHHPTYYPTFKKWADDYFFIKHRNETRGIGGIFFDYLKGEDGFNMEERFAFVKEIGNTFAPLYTHFMKKNHSLPFHENHKTWQYLRRGRYAEFNLAIDRGTKFGLETNGRTESILMSLPPQANWEYNLQIDPTSEEGKTLSFLRKGIDWVDF